jgi:hypothetical protein
MRRLASTTLAFAAPLAIGAAAVHGQTIGFKLGASIANLSIDSPLTPSSSTGFAGGGFIRFGSGMLGLQPELLSVTKGADVSLGGSNFETNLEYVEIPVLLHLTLLRGTSFSPYLFGGPTVSLEAGCSARDQDGSLDCDALPGELSDRRSTDFGVTGGGGLAFQAGPGAVLVEGRYTIGLTNINQGVGPEVRNRAPMVMAGYAIPIGRRF